MKTKLYLLILYTFIVFTNNISAQDRVVMVDFESNSFVNQPDIPFDKPFIIQGELGKEIEYVEVYIRNEGSDKELYKASWNRIPQNPAGTFNIVIPPILVSNSKYDFEIITYTKLNIQQKTKLVESLRKRIAFYIGNSFQFDGKNVSIKNPKKVYKGLVELIDNAMSYQVSKNNVNYIAPTKLILEELKKQKKFKFKKVVKGTPKVEKSNLTKDLIKEKVNFLTNMIMSELMPFINTELTQQYRVANVRAVRTDKSRFTLPINGGVYAWNKVADFNNVKMGNTNFSFGAGITIPFSSKSRFSLKSRIFNSLGLSLGVLFKPLEDATGKEFVTPGIKLPVYTALGLKIFKVIRMNAGVLIVGEKGINNVGGLSFVPTIGFALELDLWLGIKK